MYGRWINEDEFWENRREELESPRRARSPWEDDEPERETKSWYLEDEIEEIEAEYKCSMSDLYEGDLMELVERYRKTVPVSAVWDAQFDCIKYQCESSEQYF